MAQWINVLQNKGFVNPTQLPLLWKKTGAIAIVEPGLTAGRQAVSQAIRQTKCCKVRKLKLYIFDF